MQEFQPGTESITSYLEHTKVYFTANDIAERKQVAVLLSVIGAQTYSLLRSLTAPDLPQAKSLETILKQHFEPKPLVIAERFHFHPRNQITGESLAEYIAELRRHCAFRDSLNDALHDRLVCGLKSESIQKRLLLEKDLTFQKGMEAAEKNARALPLKTSHCLGTKDK